MEQASLPEAEAPSSGLSEIGRLTGVFFEPTKTFADIAERPRWLAPMLLLMAATLVFIYLIGQHLGWEDIVRQSLANSSRLSQMTAEQRERAVQTAARVASITAYAAPIAVPVSYLAIAGVLLGLVSGILSTPVKFRQVFAVICYSGLTGLVSTALSIVVLYLKPAGEFNYQNPVAFNIGAYLNPLTTSKFLYSLATSMNLFTIWTIILIAIGLKQAGGRNLSYGGAFFAVLLPWLVVVFGGAGLSAVFG
jgi:hypothetical protein